MAQIRVDAEVYQEIRARQRPGEPVRIAVRRLIDELAPDWLDDAKNEPTVTYGSGAAEDGS